MIVVLDANTLTASPRCTTLPWKILTLGASQWGVRLIVPNSVVIEVVANYERDVTTAKAAWARWNREHHKLFAPNASVDQQFQEQFAAASSYEQQLRDTLAAASAETIDPPDIPHLLLVERAAHRKRPCDDNGDGYRDTLLWFTMLDVARSQPDEYLVLVTDDNDFRADKTNDLHADLQADLPGYDAEGRVRLVRKLEDLVQELMDAEPGEGLPEYRKRLQHQAIRNFLTQETLPQLIGAEVHPAGCGLPAEITTATITTLGEPKDVHLDVRAEVGATPVVQFVTILDVTFLGASLENPETPENLVHEEKVTGLITVDHFGKPTTGSSTAFTGPDDDPVATLWRDEMVRRGGRTNGSALVMHRVRRTAPIGWNVESADALTTGAQRWLSENSPLIEQMQRLVSETAPARDAVSRALQMLHGETESGTAEGPSNAAT